jgi:predicted SAM-dependent methyltransferase
MLRTKLHLGSGDLQLPGWINLDTLPYPAVDRVVDLRRGIPYTDAAYIYAEHFVEHLTPDESLTLLRQCRKALADDGALRLSTPNLDWVLETHYRPAAWASDAAAVDECFNLNRAFHAWGHRFLYNRQTLESLLHAAGFADVQFHRYGESSDPELSGLERHVPSPDTASHQHVLVVEARGRAAETIDFDAQRIAYRRDAEMPYHIAQYSMLWLIRLVSRAGRFLTGRRSRP